MRELDQLLLQYLEQRYQQASAAERKAFEALLEMQDPDVLGFCVGRNRPTDLAMAKVVDELVRHYAPGA
jgi:antitoxin CptB